MGADDNPNQRRHFDKRCPSCEQIKSTEEFYGRTAETVSDYCRECWPKLRKKYEQGAKTKEVKESRRPKRTETEKYCKRCDNYLPLDDFYVTASGKYSGYCRDCQNAYRKERRQLNNPTASVSSKNEVEIKSSRVCRPEGKKYCPKCDDYLPLDQFYRRGPDTHLLTSRCRFHHNESNKRSKSILQD